MRIFQKQALRLGAVFPAALALLLFSVPALAAGRIYIAVYNETGGQPGIWVAEDLNSDGDAADSQETKRWAALAVPGYLDVAVDRDGVVYAISGVDRAIHRLEDKNHDGDALDAGEVTVFRDAQALGLRLERPYSLAAQTYYDPTAGKSRTRVSVMDAALQLTARLEDGDGDGDAQGGGELCVLIRNSPTTPFTANRMDVDETGRLVAVNPNTLALARVNDMNGDCSTEEPDPNAKGCSPPANCGPLFFFNEFQTIFGPLPSNSELDPFGAAIGPGGRIFLSEHWSQWQVHSLRDLNGDEDFNDANESTLFYKGPNFGTTYNGFGYDVVWGDDSALYFGLKDPVVMQQIVVMRLKDLNNDGDALDPGEGTVYAMLTSAGKPVGLAVKPGVISPKQIVLDIVDSSPKGPVLVVPDNLATPVTLTVVDREKGTPAPSLRVGGYAMRGCLQVCPAGGLTDAQGKITFTVKRLTENYLGDESETLTFRVFGDQVYLPVVATTCFPAPVAAAGPDQEVPPGAFVTLNGTGSTGAGLLYCWTQTAGPDVGLPACPAGESGTAVVTFTAPQNPGTLTFQLQVANACDAVVEDNMTVTVATSPCPAETLLGGDPDGLTTLRAVRTKVLAPNTTGQQLVDVYYAHAAEVAAILAASAPLRERARGSLRDILPASQSLASTGTGILSRDAHRRALALLTDLKQKASPPLREALARLEPGLRDGSLLTAIGLRLK